MPHTLTQTFSKWLLACAVLARVASAQEELAALNKPAPVFRLPLYNAAAAGEKAPMLGVDRYVGVDPSDRQTKLLVVSFMASFCGPCKKEMPYLQGLYSKFKDKGLRVLMVSIDREDEGQKKVAELVEANRLTFPVLKDRFNIVARRWLGQQSPLPSLFLVRPDGVISAVHRGYDQDISKTLEEEIEVVLAGK